LAAAPTLIGTPQDCLAGETDRASAPAWPPTVARRPDPVPLGGSPDGDETPVSASQPRARAPLTPTAEDMALLAEVNRQRALQALPAIRYEPRLFAAARLHCDEQLRHNYLGHGSPEPERARLSQRLGQEGYTGRMYAEVVASNFFDVPSVVEAWMQSPAHRAVLLDAELSEGAFCRLDSADRQTNRWTGDFGAPVALKVTAPPSGPLPSSPRTLGPAPAPVAPSASLPPGAVRASVPPTVAPRSQPLSASAVPPPVNASRLPPPPTSKIAAPPASGYSFGSTSGGLATNNAVPPSIAPLAPPATTTPRYVAPPTYTRPSPAPVRGPVVRRRPAPCVGGT
jgi:uncharacterized protein YkwD